ncbi:Bcr/CflA family multidrug efflux MFS transporter [Shewanella glacialipiscicola]|uniref:purine nucleoside transporter PunC n=1 Tax=Shewanella TaxID=22 RepID=UPI0021D82DEC|nr:purine nucleoside transporter PunC [Shewanella glacialipiscicola]MCU7993313.1 Bcr/CflA family multidrug efflux MFS transporter [Shewanella glacialipiscicola]MCU8024630.1 Bcr/CflA family multidrug efflux MFS transporter [Shewanella glacialipiscicola]
MKTSSNTFANIKFFMFLFYLAMLSMLGFIATDMYLPAFKAIEGSFNSTPSQVAMSLTCFLAGLALGQLLYGPLVNKIGKRWALIFGLVVFAIASIFIANSDSILMLNTARFFQAIGACSAGVIWQAIVVEQYDADKAQGIFSNIMPLVALSPALAPILGAFILSELGWRAIFISLCIIAFLLLLMTLYFVPGKTQHQHSEHTAVSYWHILKNTRYVGNVVIFGACSGAFFAYLTVWPIVMEQHGYLAKEIGLSFIPQTIMFIVGGYASKLLIKRIGANQTLNILLSVFGACVISIALFTLVFPASTIFPLLISFSILAAANGAIYPIVVNSALQQFSQNAAKAAGLQNFLQISIAFGASSLVAVWASLGEVAIGWGILSCAVLVIAGYILKSQQEWGDFAKHFTKPDTARVGITPNVKQNPAD